MENFLENELAGIFERFLARFIDRLLAIIVAAGLFFVFNSFKSPAIVSIILPILIPFSYLFFKDSLPFLNGQSIGKKLMGIRAIDFSTGEALTGKYGKTFLREIVQWIPLLNLVDALMIFGDERQRLGDRMATTQVIKE